MSDTVHTSVSWECVCVWGGGVCLTQCTPQLLGRKVSDTVHTSVSWEGGSDTVNTSVSWEGVTQ